MAVKLSEPLLVPYCTEAHWQAPKPPAELAPLRLNVASESKATRRLPLPLAVAVPFTSQLTRISSSLNICGASDSQAYSNGSLAAQASSHKSQEANLPARR